jgi:hypothetical protein
MATKTPRRLVGPVVLTQTATTVYVAPVDGAVVISVNLSNPSASPIDFTLSVGSDGEGTRIWNGHPIQADSVWQERCLLPLQDGDILQAFASTTGVAVLTISGKASNTRFAASGLAYLFGDSRHPTP